ncbi:Protein of unknown function [Pyronema omphalodes CBS 100304]|uniref:Uncharacterized protein n=1 Tax=Pyronema omphalodes (strain CBS 100304) TaxID=1076935 RepID=U4KU41_PYROM|nr:Protein of unknown function [Pyronema omphalodes CBS 100304]
MPYKINYKQTFPCNFERTSHGALWRQIIGESNHPTSPRPLYRPFEDSRALTGHVSNRLHNSRYGHYDGHHERQVFGLLIDYYELWKTPVIASGILDEIANATRSASKDGMNLDQLKTLEAVLGGWLEDCEIVMGWDEDTMYVQAAWFWTLQERILDYEGSRYGNHDGCRILKEEDLEAARGLERIMDGCRAKEDRNVFMVMWMFMDVLCQKIQIMQEEENRCLTEFLSDSDS